MTLSPASRRALDAIHSARVNFDLWELANASETGGWRIDDYCRSLPSEAPGLPVPDGPWTVACRVLRDYEFADPDIVRAVYHSDTPLEDRTMLLEARFAFLRFHFGVRVGAVTDTLTTVDDRSVRVWGWNYQTLQGHLEMGQMDYQVWKWLDTGMVEFRIHVVSRAARIPNPVIRLGFAVFGRRKQTAFARRALERMHSLVVDALADPDARRRPGTVPTFESTTVARAATRSRLRRRFSGSR